MSEPLTDVLLLFAMQAEADPLIRILNLSHKGDVISGLPCQYYQTITDQGVITLVTAGKDTRFDVDLCGTEPAVLMTHLAIEQFQPDLIINAGTAGGFATNGADIGTIYLSQGNFVYHDHHVPIVGMDQFAVGHFPAQNVSQLVLDLEFKTGVISTGSSLKKLESDVSVIQSSGAVAKDMESAAIAWISMLHHRPMIAVKSITNLVDLENDSAHEFESNFEQAVASLTEAMTKILSYIKGKSLDDLVV